MNSARRLSSSTVRPTTNYRVDTPANQLEAAARVAVGIPPSNDRGGYSQNRLEADARAAIEGPAGRSLTEAEWSAARAKLLKFAVILRAWEQAATGVRRGKLEELCQQER